eukprot:2724600-Alexandrium_andersonii.AAC.1
MPPCTAASAWRAGGGAGGVNEVADAPPRSARPPAKSSARVATSWPRRFPSALRRSRRELRRSATGP